MLFLYLIYWNIACNCKINKISEYRVYTQIVNFNLNNCQRYRVLLKHAVNFVLKYVNCWFFKRVYVVWCGSLTVWANKRG